VRLTGGAVPATDWRLPLPGRVRAHGRRPAPPGCRDLAAVLVRLQPVVLVLDDSAARAVTSDPDLRGLLAGLADLDAAVQIQWDGHVFDLADRLDRSLWRLLTTRPRASGATSS
jgi:hypothetical protein